MDIAEFREWLGSELATQQLSAALAENEVRCESCEEPLPEDGSGQGNSDWVDGVTLCQDCWIEWTGGEK